MKYVTLKEVESLDSLFYSSLMLLSVKIKIRLKITKEDFNTHLFSEEISVSTMKRKIIFK